MNNKKCLLDTSIVLDEILQRPRIETIKESVFYEYEEFFISAKTFSTVFYILRKFNFDKKSVYNRLKKYKILDTTESICKQGYKWAKSNDDVEDCMELATAFLFDCVFVTADEKLFKKYNKLTEIQLVQQS
jgi:predicted nucleic acid-binding protein